MSVPPSLLLLLLPLVCHCRWCFAAAASAAAAARCCRHCAIRSLHRFIREASEMLPCFVLIVSPAIANNSRCE